MNVERLALAIGAVAALLVDLDAYYRFDQFRALITHHHWIFYLYLGAGPAIVVSSLVAVLTRTWRRLRKG